MPPSGGVLALTRARAVWPLDHEAEHPSRWAAMISIAEKIGCSVHTLNERVKNAELDSGRRAGVPNEMVDRWLGPVAL